MSGASAAQLQNFQTIDTSVPDAGDRGPTRACRAFEANALWPMPGSEFRVRVRQRSHQFPARRRAHRRALELVAGNPLVEPRAGYFFEPAVGYDFTQYDLQNAAAGGDASSTPTRTAALCAAGHRVWYSSATRARRGSAPRLWNRAWSTATCPTAIRTKLPIFDTGLPDLNLIELFRTNRYVGEDRIGDAEPAGACGLTTRLFDHVSGTQYLSATIGQIRYFTIPRVDLPEDALRIHRADRRDRSRSQSTGLARRGAGKRARPDLGFARDRMSRDSPARPWPSPVPVQTRNLPRLGHRRRSRR